MSIEKTFNKFGCDKSKKHQYHLFYDELLNRYKAPKILEIGVFKGDSTAAFLEYIPDCEIVGVDVFERTKLEDVADRLNSNRVKLFRCNSMKAVDVNKIMNALGIKFDIIIDDGAHYPVANRLTLTNFIPFLSDNGTYVIEDVWPLDKMTLREMEHPWIAARPAIYKTLDHYGLLDEIKKIEVERSFVAKHYDFRSLTKQPDSYIISIGKE